MIYYRKRQKKGWENVNENRVRNRLFLTGTVLVVVFLVFFIRTSVFSGSGQAASGKALWPDAHDPERPVYLDENGRRVIQWEKIQVPDWVEKELLPVNEYSRPGTYVDDVAGIVVHYTANPGTTAEQNRNYFANLAESGETYVSSHFIIGIDGRILQCVPMSEVAYASNGRNCDTVSIECCHEDENGTFTKETYASLVKLTAWISDTYMIEAKDIIRHYDVTGKMCPKYFVDHEDAWEEFLRDVENGRP